MQLSIGLDVHQSNEAKGDVMGKKNTIARPERQNWRAMIRRCKDPKHPYFNRYGGSGISVCERWLHSFDEFFAYMGPRPTPKHSLDRFPNSKGNYEPGNVRWATPEQQTRNRGEYNNTITAFDVTRNLSEWCEIYDQWPNTIKKRIAKGWSPEDAVSTPATDRRLLNEIARQYREPDYSRRRRGDSHPVRLNPALVRRGSAHGASKLNETQVSEILIALSAGQNGAALGRRYGVTKTVISSIKNGRSWKHIERPIK